MVIKIGLLGGLSYYSTEVYYRKINKLIEEHLGNLESAHIVLNSLNAKKSWQLLEENNHYALEKYLLEGIKLLEKTNVDIIAICCNSVHFLINSLQKKTAIPIIDIISAAIDNESIKKSSCIGVLSTRFTLNQNIYQKKIIGKNCTPILPNNIDSHIISQIVLNLCSGKQSIEDKKKLLTIAKKLKKNGANTIILGCTELGLLIKERDVNDCLIIDSAIAHSTKIAEFYLNNEKGKLCVG